MGEHVKSVIHNTIGSTLSTLLVAGGLGVIFWLRGLAFHWAVLIGASFLLAVTMAANFISVIMVRHRKPSSSANKGAESEAKSTQRLRDQVDQNEQLQGELHTLTQVSEREMAKLKSEKGMQGRELAKLRSVTQWLIDIAEDQRQTIHRFLHFTSVRYGRHELMRGDPYLEFALTVDNRSLFDVSFLELDGSIRFDQRELGIAPEWQSRIPITQGNAGNVGIRQRLTKEDVVYILNGSSDKETGFVFGGLKINIEGNHGLTANFLQIHRMPLTNKELLAAYPKLGIEIVHFIYDWTQDTRTGEPCHPLHEPCFVTLLIKIRNRRPTSIAIETFKLSLLVNGKALISFAEDTVFARRIVNQEGIEYGEGSHSQNLNENTPIMLIEDKPIEGALQFIFRDLRYVESLTNGISLNNAPFTLILIDKDGERHTQQGILPSEGVRYVNPEYK
jgi:hypothetical protein